MPTTSKTTQTFTEESYRELQEQYDRWQEQSQLDDIADSAYKFVAMYCKLFPNVSPRIWDRLILTLHRFVRTYAK